MTKEERREYQKRYREMHPEKFAKSSAKWNKANIEKMRENAHKYYHEVIKNNPEALAKRAEYHAKWQRENKDKLNAYHREYRRRKREKTDE